MSRWRPGPEPWWPTVYAEQQYMLPDTPSCHDPALERFAMALAVTLLRSLPARYPASYSLGPVEWGEGVAVHEVEEDYPRVFPCLRIVTPQSTLESKALQHYRYHPDVFDADAGWARRLHVLQDIRPIVNRLRRNVGGREVPMLGDEHTSKLDMHRLWHPSSYRLAWATERIASDIITAECDLLEVPMENRPNVALQSLQVVACEGIVMATSSEARV